LRICILIVNTVDKRPVEIDEDVVGPVVHSPVDRRSGGPELAATRMCAASPAATLESESSMTRRPSGVTRSFSAAHS